MRKSLFDKVIGADFKITNYKVHNLEELKVILEKQHTDLNHRLYDENHNYYRFEENEASPYEVGYHELMEMFNTNNFLNSLQDTERYKISITQRLKFMASKSLKIEFLEKELQKLEIRFSQNPYNDILSPDNYFNEIRSKDFYDKLWNTHKSENRESYLEFLENYKFRSYNREELMESNIEKGSFIEFFDILKCYSVINFQLDELNVIETKLKDISMIIKENKYPRVFTNGYACELFNYLFSVESKEIGPAWASKFFLLFKEENLIKNKAKPSFFMTFLNEKHHIKIKTWDDRASYGGDEMDFLKDAEKDFKDFHNIKRP